MQAMVGREEPVDPSVARRPLPFSRAWMAAFLLAMIAVGWTAIVDQFDGLSERSHVARLDSVVTQMESALVADEEYRLAKGAEDLAAVTAGRPESGSESLDRIWNRVSLLAIDAQAIERGDMQAYESVVQRLRAATTELQTLVHQSDGLTTPLFGG
jgi:hypothetical protein